MSPLPSWAGNVSRETFSTLEQYAALLLKWNRKINLIGPATESDIWTRHIADAIQLLPLIPPSISMADLGSGAGLPGLVIAICRPDLNITLIEQDQRKSAFLREAIRTLGLSHVSVEVQDIAKTTGKYDLITARALASLDLLFALSHPLLSPTGTCLFPKGENFANEVGQARVKWDFDEALTPSKTHEKSCIVSVTKLMPKDRN